MVEDARQVDLGHGICTPFFFRLDLWRTALLAQAPGSVGWLRRSIAIMVIMIIKIVFTIVIMITTVSSSVKARRILGAQGYMTESL